MECVLWTRGISVDLHCFLGEGICKKSPNLESVVNWQENQAGPTKHLVFVVDRCASDVVGPVLFPT